MEIDERFSLLKPGMRVVDLGAAPGGWSQVIANRVNSDDQAGTVIAADLLEFPPIPNVKIIQGDINDEKTIETVSEAMDFQRAHLVCSDAVPDFMGDRFVDHM